jgi:stearoyl-CoA desaturase (Delta-9 desaturase)
VPLQYVFAIAGAGAVEGSIRWWSRGHRAHHRYTDTELDPYDANKGFFWSHVGWMLVKPRRRPGAADISDLNNNAVIQWQHRWYLYLIVGMGFVVPTLVAGLGWGDWRGGFFYAGAGRLLFVHHVRLGELTLSLSGCFGSQKCLTQSTFCVNSLAHWLGDQPFDSKKTPRDHVVTALVTLGEGYHNFHHEFPQDYRNAIKFYQWDPTKWLILVCYYVCLRPGWMIPVNVARLTLGSAAGSCFGAQDLPQ